MSLPDDSDPTTLASRLTDLEFRLTHQEAILETLNDVIVRQQQQIDKLDRELSQARKRLRELDVAPGDPEQPEPPPPHY